MRSTLPTWPLSPWLKWTLQVSQGSLFIACPGSFFFFLFLFFNPFSPSLPSVNWDTVWRANTTAKFQVSTELNRNVGLLRLFPGITAATVRHSATTVRSDMLILPLSQSQYKFKLSQMMLLHHL